MAKVRPWIVTPHSPLETLDENLWCVTSPVPGLPGAERRMAVVRRDDGALLFYNAIPLDDPTLAKVRELGKPAILIVPNVYHALDAAPFRERLGLEAYAPRESLDVLGARLPIKGTLEEVPPDPATKVERTPGFKTGEAVLIVTTGPRKSLVVADLVTNARRVRGVNGFLMHLVGFTGDEPKLPKPVKWRVARDKPALRAQLGELAELPGLCRIVVSHGEIVAGDGARVLQQIANTV
jgi:hypothetical protein